MRPESNQGLSRSLPDMSMALRGIHFCLTGTYPSLSTTSADDLSDATGRLDVGKYEAKVLIVSHGGIVTNNVSAKTMYLIAGESPGAGKLEKAAKGRAQLIDLKGLDALIAGESPGPATIGFFSTGFGGNTIGYKKGKSAVDELMKRGQKRDRS